ncbi:MAG: NAD(P)-dependent oxidoreductase [Nocardioidaceae bacterium]
MRIAVLGTGIMGAGMVRSLLREGFEVAVWNRTTAKAGPLAEDGATVSSSAADAVRDADVVLTMLFDADAVLEVIGGLDLDGAAVWLQSSTIGLDGVRRVARLASERGLTVLDAPVLGTKAPAEQGRLVPIVSGDPEAVRRVRPVLDAIGSKTVDAGTELGRATALKLTCNAWVITLTAAVGQSMAMASRLGLEPGLFLEAIGGGATDTPYAHVKGEAMVAGDYPAAFALDGAVKDLDLITAAAQEAGVADDVLAAVRIMFAKASDHGHGDEDMGAVYTAFDGR